VERIVVSDTLAIAPDRAGRIEIVSIAPLIANAVARLHRDESLAGLSAFDWAQQELVEGLWFAFRHSLLGTNHHTMTTLERWQKADRLSESMTGPG